MTLFPPPDSSKDEEFIGSDVATRALSVTAVENDFGPLQKAAIVIVVDAAADSDVILVCKLR